MSHAGVTFGSGWMLARQMGSRDSDSAARPASPPVGEHHHEDAVQTGVLELAHLTFGVLAVLDGLARDEVAHLREVRGQFRRVPGLALGDTRDHVVVEILHDPQDPGSGRLRMRLARVRMASEMPETPRDELPTSTMERRPLAGKTILLHAEQGLGDSLQFIRFAALVKLRGEPRILFSSPPALAKLIESCPGVDRVLTNEFRVPDFDVHASVMSLPALLGDHSGHFAQDRVLSFGRSRNH